MILTAFSSTTIAIGNLPGEWEFRPIQSICRKFVLRKLVCARQSGTICRIFAQGAVLDFGLIEQRVAIRGCYMLQREFGRCKFHHVKEKQLET